MTRLIRQWAALIREEDEPMVVAMIVTPVLLVGAALVCVVMG